jgi:hypothetical protein
MKRFATAALGAAALLVSQSAFSQTPAPASPQAPAAAPWFAGGATGVTITKKTGGEIYGEIGKEVWPKTQISLEAGWMSSVVSGHRVDAAGAIANYLAQTQGQPASATVKVPAGYGVVNVRRTVYTKPRYSVYGLGGLGFAVTSPKTKFVLGGTDVSGSMPQYGVTIGKDLAGSSASALLNFGVGATAPYKDWSGEVSYRLTPIFTTGGATIVNRFNFGVTRHFNHLGVAGL